MSYDLTNPPKWFERELSRLTSGEYDPVPWPDPLTSHPGHFVHLSSSSPGNIAYTRSSQHGEQDRQTTLKPGKYLTKYFPDIPAPEVARLAGLVSATNKSSELHIATTREEIAHVYKNGPESCMSHTFSSLSSHPSEVYAGPDTAVAYLKGTRDRIVARAVIRISEPKGYMRLYGDDHRLLASLESNGYGDDVSFEGCRLLLIQHDNRIIAPYVDGGTSASSTDSPRTASIVDDYLVLTDDGELNLGSTRGYITVHECCSCGCSVDEEDVINYDDDEWCRTCFEDTYVPLYQGGYANRDDAIEVDGPYGTTYVTENQTNGPHFFTCFLTEDIIYVDETRQVYPDRQRASLEALCDSQDYHLCTATNRWYHVDELVTVDGNYYHNTRDPRQETIPCPTPMTTLPSVMRFQGYFDASEEISRRNLWGPQNHLWSSRGLPNGGYEITFHSPAVAA